MVSDWMANWLLIFPTDGLPYIGAKQFAWTIMIKGLEICPIHLPRLRNLMLLQPKTTYGSTIIFYTICLLGTFNNSLWLSEAFIHQETSQALVQFMACCLFGAKPSSKLMLDKCQWDPWKQNDMQFESKYKKCLTRKCICKSELWNGSHFCHGLRMLNISRHSN